MARSTKTSNNGAHTVTLPKVKTCKSVIRFETDNENAIVRNVYVARPTADEWSEVTLVVSGK
jgi:hypothetical protein